MSFLSGAIHIVAQPIGWGAEGVGAVTGSKSATNLGHNITSPTVTLSNPGGITKSSDPAFSGNGAYGNTSGANPTKNNASASANPANPYGSLTSTGGASSGSSSPAESAALAALLGQYNQNIGMYNNDLSTTKGFQGADTSGVNNDYNAQAKTYNDQLNQGNAQLDQQTGVLNDSYERSLQQLGNQIRNQFQGTLNDLGVGGAGDSSAAQMAAYALAQDQNMNRSYMNQDLNNQLSQIGLQRNDLKQNYNDQMAQLSSAHSDALRQIAEGYADKISQIEHNIEATEQDKASAKAYLGQWANAQVQNLDANVMQQAQSLNAQYAHLAVQNPNLTYKPDFQATTITNPNVPAQATTSQQVTPTAPLLAPGYNSNKDTSS